MQIASLVFLAVMLVACDKAEEPIEPVAPTPDERAVYADTSDRLVANHVHGGFGVVSRKPDGSPEHRGEGLIWGGTAMWAMSCERGQGISDAMRAMILANDGALIRIDPLDDYNDGRQATLDGALGALLGIARRVADCGEADLWSEPMARLRAFQAAHGGRLHPGVYNDPMHTMFGPFKDLRDLVARAAGVDVSEPDLGDLEVTIGDWAALVLAAHRTGMGSDACYRVNLGMTSFFAMETVGRSVSGKGRDHLCSVTGDMEIPTVDHWCGRQSIVEYVANYQPDVWEYRHQRCSWESEDGDGNKSPELDRLVALVMAHGWHSLQ